VSLDDAALAPLLRGANLVVHLAGTSDSARSNEAPADEVANSLVPTLRLLELCRRERVGRILYASSGGTIYGVSQPKPIREDHPTRPITAYGINKLAAEQYLELYQRLHDLDSITLRIANPYGPHQQRGRAQGVVGAMMWQALSGHRLCIFGDGSVVRDYLFIDDVARAFLATATYCGEARLFNVGSGFGRSIRDVAEGVRLALGRAVPIDFKPARAADVPHNVLDSSLLRRETGWIPSVSWMDGLAATASWMIKDLAASPLGQDRR
jgi:UDP-glucose 4-epimerase